MAVGAVLLGAGAGASMASNMFPPLSEKFSQEAFELFPNRIPNIAELIELRYRELIDKGTYQVLCNRNGFDNQHAENLYRSQIRYLSEGDLISSWRRGIINENTLDDFLSKLHYSQDSIKIAKKVSEFFPTPADLVRFAVREVYTPEIVAKFGQMEDLPEKFLTEASKTGLQQEQAKNYWAAHWELPSALQGFEMLHRGVINEQELMMLLRALDVMPFWRDKLTQISYKPYTRVDVRRMYGLGILDKDAVYQSYKDLGYNDEKAENMTQFTIKYEASSDLGLSQSNIITAYKKDIISTEECRQFLLDIGYSEDAAQFLITLADYDKAVEEIELQVENLRLYYRIGDITLQELRNQLDALDLSAQYVQSIITKELATNAKRRKLPTKADVDRWLKLQIIDENEYKNYLSRRGYSDIDITHYLRETNIEIDTSEKKHLPIRTYQRWLSSQIISESIFRTYAIEMGFDEIKITQMIKASKAGIE